MAAILVRPQHIRYNKLTTIVSWPGTNHMLRVDFSAKHKDRWRFFLQSTYTFKYDHHCQNVKSSLVIIWLCPVAMVSTWSPVCATCSHPHEGSTGHLITLYILNCFFRGKTEVLGCFYDTSQWQITVLVLKPKYSDRSWQCCQNISDNCQTLSDNCQFLYQIWTFLSDNFDLSQMSDTFHKHSSPPSAAYMRQWIRQALVQIMACRLFGAKPLSEPMQDYYQMDPCEQTSVKF